ncbi:MAG: DNA-binding transcriptional LysR family regulator [Psychromonas sp.]|jgi:DNA-binding transcriptional LysR family regulator|uniref:LysR family transcriptional regulator n=1 Tax=Psychromonas sp. TaxID=1884585 RepID=UPI0039E26020
MKAKDISNLYWFCQSVECGGFTAASLQTKVSAPTLSRAVSQLEEVLGDKLLHRNAKKFQLTTDGEECYQRFASIFHQIDDQWTQLSNSQTTLTGDIHVSCSEAFADYYLQPLSIEFMNTHPNVSIHIHFSSDTERFFDDQIDLAVVTTPAQTPSLVQRRLFESPLSFAAAPSYLEKHGKPTQVEELLKHHLLASRSIPYLELKQKGQAFKVPVNPKYSINSLRLTIQAAKAGLGICIIPSVDLKIFEQNGELEEVLQDVECPSGNVDIVWSDRKLISARVVAFRDMMFERMNNPIEFLSSLLG